ncbi:cysteine-rich motor neuron 1 protein-like [Pangasianodon hypophthalmus]|uniref:cysteine-rich motor neuron 1 protein-like n=1 Tax=Pangasianodon hypophthalmus TaxID=310915 RepID=UPI002307AA9E|nr:cysteine-rich motor neuron 1 protein-like [Pangasianodon hypophthalmus]
MVSSTLWILARILAFVCLLMPGSGFLLLREGEKCGGFIEGMCESDFLCLSDEPKDENIYVEGVCTRVPACNCSEFQCPPRRRGDCRSGVATDPCGCCVHCAKQKGQVCGGPSWRWGYCDQGLICSLVVGMDSARAPQIGVCKEVPDHLIENFTAILCPIRTGCNIHVGNCDCYSEQSCHSLFRYSTFEQCRQDQIDEEIHYITGELPKRDRPAYVCMEWGCEVQGCQCVCQERKCDYRTTPLSEAACCNMLKESGCRNASCPEIPPPPCPEDSFISEPHTDPGQCCPVVPAMCTCNFQTCAPKPTYCPNRGLPKLVVKGNGHPGTCCDLYECVKEGD